MALDLDNMDTDTETGTQQLQGIANLQNCNAVVAVEDSTAAPALPSLSHLCGAAIALSDTYRFSLVTESTNLQVHSDPTVATNPFRITASSWRNDATNSHIWCESKLTSLELETMALVNLKDLGNHQFLSAYVRQRRWLLGLAQSLCKIIS